MGVHFLCTDGNKNKAATVSTAANHANNQKGQVRSLDQFISVKYVKINLCYNLGRGKPIIFDWCYSICIVILPDDFYVFTLVIFVEAYYI